MPSGHKPDPASARALVKLLEIGVTSGFLAPETAMAFLPKVTSIKMEFLAPIQGIGGTDVISGADDYVRVRFDGETLKDQKTGSRLNIDFASPMPRDVTAGTRVYVDTWVDSGANYTPPAWVAEMTWTDGEVTRTEGKPFQQAQRTGRGAGDPVQQYFPNGSLRAKPPDPWPLPNFAPDKEEEQNP